MFQYGLTRSLERPHFDRPGQSLTNHTLRHRCLRICLPGYLGQYLKPLVNIQAPFLSTLCCLPLIVVHEAMDTRRAQDSGAHNDRERSRSPYGVRSIDTSSTTRGRRGRKRSFDWAQFRAETAARHAAWDTEEDRRRNLTPEKRLEEDGVRWLRHEFGTEPQAIILL